MSAMQKGRVQVTSESLTWHFLNFEREGEAWRLCGRCKGDNLHLLQREEEAEPSLRCAGISSWPAPYFCFSKEARTNMAYMLSPSGATLYSFRWESLTYLTANVPRAHCSVCVLTTLHQIPAGQVLAGSDLRFLVDGSSEPLATQVSSVAV